jgi:ABC-type dipeptide/oligopeptide/nickel transport system ATPase component
MKADHILVVMNGKVVEQGSHQQLIHSRGKYHDLWSKQIFVKPDNERSRSRSPGKQQSNIVNDLSPARHKAELSKAMKTTDHDCPTENDGKQSEEGKKTSSDHKREVSPGAE